MTHSIVLVNGLIHWGIKAEKKNVGFPLTRPTLFHPNLWIFFFLIFDELDTLTLSFCNIEVS